MADEADVVLQLWQARRAQAKQTEDQRTAMTNIVLVVSSAAFGLLAQQGLKPSMIIVTALLFALGMYGVLGTIKYYERYKYHIAEADVLYGRLDELFPDAGLVAGYRTATGEHLRRYPIIGQVRLYLLWVCLHAGIAMSGGVLTGVVLLRSLTVD